MIKQIFLSEIKDNTILKMREECFTYERGLGWKE